MEKTVGEEFWGDAKAPPAKSHTDCGEETPCQTCVTLRLTTVYASLRRQLPVIDDYTVCGAAAAGHNEGHLLSD